MFAGFFILKFNAVMRIEVFIKRALHSRETQDTANSKPKQLKSVPPKRYFQKLRKAFSCQICSDY